MADARAGLRVAGAAVVVVDAVAGVQVQTEKVWKYANEYNLPRAIVVNRLDEATAAIAEATRLRPDLVSLRRLAYLVAFIRNDTAGMARELEAARRLKDVVLASDWDARAAAFGGRIRAAHDQFRRAIQPITSSCLPRRQSPIPNPKSPIPNRFHHSCSAAKPARSRSA